MPATGDRITKRKDGRYTVHTPDEPKWKCIYGPRPKRCRVAEALGVKPH